MTPQRGEPPLDYDNLADDYTRHRRINREVLRGLIEVAHPTAASRVLEVGCGTGNYLAALQEATGCEAWGIDPSPAMLERARQQPVPLHLLPGAGEAIPMPDDRFDLVYSVDVIHHVRDRAASWREARRVLRRGGLLCTVTDSADDIRRRRPLSSHFPETVAVELRRYPAIETLAAEMAAAGFARLPTRTAEVAYDLADAQGYRDRAYSSLHLIDDAAWRSGLVRLERDLEGGPVRCRSLYTLVWAIRS